MSIPGAIPTTSVHPDRAALAEAAAGLIAEGLRAAVSERGLARLVITGGGTGIATLAALREESVPWPQVLIYLGDERFVAATDPDRNILQAREALFDHLDLPPENIREVLANDGGVDIDEAVRHYTAVLAADARSAAADGAAADGIPPLDIHLLGVGPDGHVNSLFPGHTPQLEETRPVAAETASPKPPAARVTLTYPVIRRARHVYLLAAGAEKADAVAASLGSAAKIAEHPAAGARGAESTVWFLDHEAARHLPQG